MAQRKVTIEWQTPDEIVYGARLSEAQLNAKATYQGKQVSGDYTYKPEAGTLLKAGRHELHVTFTPKQPDEWTVAEGTIEIDVAARGTEVTGITARNKEYDGTTTATLDTGSAKLDGLVGDDNVTLDATAATGSFVDKNVGTKKVVTVSGLVINGPDAGNYTLTQPTATADVSTASLTVAGITAQNKKYDGTTTATLDTGSVKLDGLVGDDNVTMDATAATGSFVDKNVGTKKVVTVSGLVINGPDAGNYTLTQPTATADVSSASLTVAGITAKNKEYDGTTTAPLDTGSAKLDGLVGDDNVTLDATAAKGSFVDKNVGTKKVVTVSGLVINGLDAGNYTLTQPTATADVSTTSLMVAGITAQGKEYDGTTAATLDLGSASMQGVAPGDNVTLDATAATGSFVDKNVGAKKMVKVSGLVINGPDAGNYTLTQLTVTADVSTTSLTVAGITAEDKEYDGTTVATLDLGSASLQGVVLGDNVTLDATAATGSFVDKNVGAKKVVTVSGLGINGPDAGNYTLTQPTATANITSPPYQPQLDPANNLLSSLKRALSDPQMNRGLARLVREASSQFGGSKLSDSKTVVKQAFDYLANAISGTDALKAESEPGRGQLRLEIYLSNPVTGRQEPLNSERLRKIDIHLVDENWRLASSVRTNDGHAILFNQVEAGSVFVVLPLEIAEGGEISPDYLVSEPGSDTLKPPSNSDDQCAKGFLAKICVGQQTRMRLICAPPQARVRCFSCLEDDGCCSQGNQNIQSVEITAMQGKKSVACQPTLEDGSRVFPLPPGWYEFSAPNEVTIDGCNFSLSSSSPVSAYLGADQGCSDIYFRYKKKGNEIVVDSEICHAEVGDPNEEVRENFPGMQYLLLQECDQTFAQQQTSVNGEPVYFRNLAAGTYLLFCQAPATFGLSPVRPVEPKDGRLSLRVFAGQTSPVPILVRFHTTITTPPVLNGFVRDETGQPIPGQLVRIVDQMGCVLAAGLTDGNGFYSIQLYRADDVTIMVGAQKAAVSKNQIQAAMKPIGTPALPSARTTIERVVQDSELVGFEG